jgi:hypothetical protein
MKQQMEGFEGGRICKSLNEKQIKQLNTDKRERETY